MSHTIAPWSFHTEGRRAFILDADGATIGELVAPGQNCPVADVAHIVKCVNAHDDLLHALYTALPFVEDAESLPPDAYKPGAIDRAVKQTRDALSKAEGKAV